MPVPAGTPAIQVKVSETFYEELNKLAQEESRSMSNLIKHVMQQYVSSVDQDTLPDVAPKVGKGSKWDKDGQTTCVVVRLPKPLKDEFYRIAKLQGHKSSSLIKKLIKERLTQIPITPNPKGNSQKSQPQ